MNYFGTDANYSLRPAVVITSLGLIKVFPEDFLDADQLFPRFRPTPSGLKVCLTIHVKSGQ